MEEAEVKFGIVVELQKAAELKKAIHTKKPPQPAGREPQKAETNTQMTKMAPPSVSQASSKAPAGVMPTTSVNKGAHHEGYHRVHAHPSYRSASASVSGAAMVSICITCADVAEFQFTPVTFLWFLVLIFLVVLFPYSSQPLKSSLVSSFTCDADDVRLQHTHTT